jgi:hypothetical protein
MNCDRPARGVDAMMLLVGTAKGLFRVTREAVDDQWQIDGPHLPGYAVLHTLQAPDGRLYAATSHKIWGAHIYTSEDHGASWTSLEAVPQHPPPTGRGATRAIWYLALGVYRSEDGGETWQPANAGVRAENLPEPFPETGHNVHRVIMHPRLPSRLYRQCYNGTYRSDDGGRSWTEITAGLPSDFGYGIVADPNDPDTVFQIPESSAHLRAPVDGILRVYRSRDGGGTWESASAGLPAEHVYVTVLREAMDVDSRKPCGVYFGTSGGQLFASADAGAGWGVLASYLPRVLSVKAVAGVPE